MRIPFASKIQLILCITLFLAILTILIFSLRRAINEYLTIDNNLFTKQAKWLIVDLSIGIFLTSLTIVELIHSFLLYVKVNQGFIHKCQILLAGFSRIIWQIIFPFITLFYTFVCFQGIYLILITKDENPNPDNQINLKQECHIVCLVYQILSSIILVLSLFMTIWILRGFFRTFRTLVFGAIGSQWLVCCQYICCCWKKNFEKKRGQLQTRTTRSTLKGLKTHIEKEAILTSSEVKFLDNADDENPISILDRRRTMRYTLLKKSYEKLSNIQVRILPDEYIKIQCNDYTQIVDVAVLNRLEGQKTEECQYCNEKFQLEDELMSQPLCRHKFHKNCGLAHFKENNSCYMCQEGIAAQIFVSMNQHRVLNM